MSDKVPILSNASLTVFLIIIMIDFSHSHLGSLQRYWSGCCATLSALTYDNRIACI